MLNTWALGIYIFQSRFTDCLIQKLRPQDHSSACSPSTPLVLYSGSSQTLECFQSLGIFWKIQIPGPYSPTPAAAPQDRLSTSWVERRHSHGTGMFGDSEQGVFGSHFKKHSSLVCDLVPVKEKNRRIKQLTSLVPLEVSNLVIIKNT